MITVTYLWADDEMTMASPVLPRRGDTVLLPGGGVGTVQTVAWDPVEMTATVELETS
jgi:hypothetical protein